MPGSKNYSEWTLEELLIEEKNTKKKQTMSALIIGFATGVIVYGVARNGFGFLYIFIPLILIFMTYRSSQDAKQTLKQIQEEINKRNIK